jgi:hypothetical protein
MFPLYADAPTLAVSGDPSSGSGVHANIGTYAKDRNGKIYYKYDSGPTAWVLITSSTSVLVVPTAHASRHKTGGADVLAIANATTTEGADATVTTATMVASRRNGMMVVVNPVAAVVDNIVGAALPADGAAVVAAQPDWPRKLQVDIVDGDASISAGTLTIVGTDQNGAALTEAFTLTGGTQNLVSAKAFASVTSATFSGMAGAVGPDTVSVGVTADLGLIGQQIPAASGFVVYLAYADNTRETVGTVDATAGTISPTTAPNGAHDYQFFYTFSVTEVQSSHSHSHTHTHVAHTHTIT